MFFGMTQLGLTQPIWLLTSADGVTPASATGSPAYTVYEEGTGTSVVNGSMTGEVDSKTGLYRASLTVSAGNGYASGKTYFVHMSYVVSTVTYVQTGSFVVV